MSLFENDLYQWRETYFVLFDEATRPQAEDVVKKFSEYMYLRDNPAGKHREIWYHEQGDRSWLVVTRNTLTHEITEVELARDVARERGRSA